MKKRKQTTLLKRQKTTENNKIKRNDKFEKLSDIDKKKFVNREEKNKIKKEEIERKQIEKISENTLNLRAIKLRIYPNKTDRSEIRRWMGVCRFVYNKCLSKVYNKEENINFQTLRNKYVTTKNNNLNDWEISVPKEVRANAVRDLIKSYKTCFSQMKSSLIKKFNMSYKTKKQTSSLTIENKAIEVNGKYLKIYPRFLSKIRICNDNFLKRNKNFNINRDCRLIYERNKWFISIPYIRKVEKIIPKYDICSLDPGSKTFQTVFSPEQVFKIQQNKELFNKLNMKLDKLRSLKDKKEITNQTYSKKINKIGFRYNNLINELHYKTANLLTKQYKYIFLPSFETQDMVQKISNKRVNRNLMNLNHFKFKQRLLNKASLLMCDVNICSESYTSQTCPKCGILTNDKCANIHKCSKCKFEIDHDINGARNIYMKNILSSLSCS